VRKALKMWQKCGRSLKRAWRRSEVNDHHRGHRDHRDKTYGIFQNALA